MHLLFRERERERDLLQLRAKLVIRAFKIAGYKTKENIIANTEKKNALPQYLSWYHFLRKNEIRDYFYVTRWTIYKFELLGIFIFIFWIDFLVNKLFLFGVIFIFIFCYLGSFFFFGYLSFYLFVYFLFLKRVKD